MTERPTVERSLLEQPIPLELPQVTGWKEIPIKECREPLVPLGPFSEYRDIFTDSIYFGERFDSPYIEPPLEGGICTIFVRKSVAEQLRKAQKLLPQTMYLVVFDAYRTLDVQQSLFDGYFKALRQLCPDWSNDQLLAETQKYVSLPSKDPTKPSPHNTGGAVDLMIFYLPEEINQKVKEINHQLKRRGITWQEEYLLEMEEIAQIRKNARLLNFGTPFDWGSKEAALNYYECQAQIRSLTPQEEEARVNRRLLYNVMKAAFFEAYPDEYWHFNSHKSQMGAKTARSKVAQYGAATLSEKNLEHERMRRDHRLGTIRILQGWVRPVGKVYDPLKEHFKVAKEAALETGDPRITSLPKAAVISPPTS